MSVQFKPADTAYLQQQIEDIENQIKQQEATIAKLTAEGHEVTDATRHFRELLVTLAGLRREEQQSR